MKKIWKIFVGVIFLAVCSGCGIKKEQKKTIEDTKEKIYRECEMLAEGYQSIYENAVKENALYELSTIQKSMDYFGKYGYAVIDSYNQLDMVQSIKVDDFLKKAEKEKNGKTTIFQVIAGDYFIRYDLKTKQGKIDVEVSSFKWKEDTWQETYYHEFRANSWKYTENGYFFIEEYQAKIPYFEKKRAVQHKSYFDTYPENQANRLGEKVTRLKSPGKITA